MNLYELTPFATEGETFAQAIDRNMQLLGKDDVAIVRDHDTQFTTNDWYPRILAHVKNGMQFGTCYTNRVYSGFQIAKDAPHDDDMLKHWKFGHHLSKMNDGKRTTVESGRMSGMLFVITKKAWDMLTPFETDTITALDNEIHTKMDAAGIPLQLMEDVYIYHRYRFGDRNDIAHLTKAPVQATVVQKPIVGFGSMRKVCYTIITGNYDTVQQPDYLTRDWEYLLFTDRPDLYGPMAGSWTVMPLEPTDNPVLLQRTTKAIGPLRPEKGQLLRTIYIDGNQQPVGNLDRFVSDCNHPDGGITIKRHPERDCAYDECEAVIKFGKDTEENVAKAKRWLKKLKHPKNAGLSETGIIIRDHTDPSGRGKLSLALQAWAKNITTLSHRDQLTFDATMAQFPKVVVNHADPQVFNTFFTRRAHTEPTKVPVVVTTPTIAAKAKDERPFSEDFDLNIFTTARPDQVEVIPLFVFHALSSNPGAHVEVWMTDRVPTPDMSEVLAAFPGQFVVRQSQKLRDDRNGHFSSQRFFLQPSVKTRYVFLPNIDLMIGANVLETMLPRMKRTGLRYSNAMRTNMDDRMLTNHFTEFDAFWPHAFDPEDHSVRDCNTEILLNRIVRSKNPPPIETDRPQLNRNAQTV